MATHEGTQRVRTTRRRFLKTITAAGVGAAASPWFAAGAGQRSLAFAAASLRRGGTLKIAEIGEPLTLDAPATTATVTAVITLPIFEGLFAFDAGWRLRPELATGYTVSKDGLTYTITLRSNVPFHNGKTLTADDVVASLNRWGKVNPQGSVPFRTVDTVTAPASDTVVIKMKAPFAPLINFLALAGSCGIMPKEVVDGVGPGGLKQYIGTGPYKFVEWAPDRYVHLTRFDQYAARSEPASLFAGQKVALADDIFYYPVSQVAARIAGVQSGDYDIADGINQDAYAQLKADPRVSVGLLGGYYLTFFMNKRQGVMANEKLRQAVDVALDMQPIMQATFGDPKLYDLDPSMYPKGTPWYTTAGANWYNVHNTDQAKQLAKEAGYSGQTIRWLTTQDYDYMFKSSVVAVSQLQHAGFQVNMQVMDWATLLDRRAKPTEWDVFVTSGVLVPDPALLTIFSSTYPGWWDTPEKNALFAQFNSETDQAKRVQLWIKLQAMMYAEVPVIRPGGFNNLMLSRKGVQGFKPSYIIVPWNVQPVG
jgi:peptide/nickel transport system substrate-binding protein